MIRCLYCGRELDPNAPTVWKRVVGWERKAQASSRRSGSDIALRQSREKFACDDCIRKIKRGIAPTQSALL